MSLNSRPLQLSLAALTLLIFTLPLSALETNTPPWHPNVPEMVEADGHLRLDFTPEMMVLPRGLQPSLLCTTAGTLVVQAQIPEKSLPANRQVYPTAMETRISRDQGKTWTIFPRPPGQ